MVKKKDNTKEFLMITGSMFSAVAALHLMRALFQWDLVIGSFAVPIFWSWYLAFTAGFFAVVSFNLVNKVK